MGAPTIQTRPKVAHSKGTRSIQAPRTSGELFTYIKKKKLTARKL